MADQVVSRNLSDAEISALIAATNADTSLTIYELLPQFIRSQDPDEVIRGFFQAVQEEYDRNKSMIREIITVVDPYRVNKSNILEGNFVFFHPEQFIYGATCSASPPRAAFTGPSPGVSASGFYNDFAIFVWADSGNPSAVGQYRVVNAYDGPSKTAYLDQDWEFLPSDKAILALCWPDRVWLPVAIVSDPRKAGGTTFPAQVWDETELAEIPAEYRDTNILVKLPGLSYLSTIDHYYKGWSLDFLDGRNEGKSSKIVAYYASTKIAVLESRIYAPDAQDWFRITPPVADNIGISDNYYKGRWIHVAAPTKADISYGTRIRAQTRQIIRSKFDPLTVPASHVAYLSDPRTDAGDPFEYPPAPTMLYGITNSYVPLQHMAALVGIELDAQDAEIYQREQISQAYNFHRLRGTRRALELVCNSFGLDVAIDEAASNYTHAPSEEDVGPSAVPDLNHEQFGQSTIVPVVKAGLGADDVPVSYLTEPGRSAARIPDSDIKLFLSRTNINAEEFNADILTRILRKLRPHMPIHVQIIFVGLLTKINDPVNVTGTLTCQIGPLFPEDVAVSESLFSSPVGTVPERDEYEIATNDGLTISSPARYRNTSTRIGRNSHVPALTRWSRGTALVID